MITPATILRRFFSRGTSASVCGVEKLAFRKRGFTLVEVIIASSVFTIVSLIGVTVFINVTRIQRRIALENAIYEDGRFMMERISREIRSNTLDYEEYYNKGVEGGVYGEHYTCYASRFYHPGTGGQGPGNLGAQCSVDPAPLGGGDPAAYPGCIIDKTTLDVNTGKNPYEGNIFTDGAAPDANGLCDQQFGGATDCSLSSWHDVDQLYLINPKGTKKTIFARKRVQNTPSDEFALGMLEIEGADTNTDSIVDQWVDLSGPNNYFCSLNYDCPGTLASLESTLDGTTSAAAKYQGFVPISPMRTTITDLRFYIAPVDDPRKAFAETDPSDAIQQQPHVTVVMVLQPSASELSSFNGEVPTITLQNTISSRVYNDVKSYTGNETCADYLPTP